MERLEEGMAALVRKGIRTILVDADKHSWNMDVSHIEICVIHPAEDFIRNDISG